jgi:hypothetical protein
MSLLPESNTKFSASGMVLWGWGHLKNGRRHAPPLLWDGTEVVNTKQYIEVLDTRGEALDWDCCRRMSLHVTARTEPRPHNQNHQACLKANLKDHCPKEIWPPGPLDWNPLEYFMWSEFERKVSKHNHNTLAFPNAKILVVMAKIDREVVIPACKKV